MFLFIDFLFFLLFVCFCFGHTGLCSGITPDRVLGSSLCRWAACKASSRHFLAAVLSGPLYIFLLCRFPVFIPLFVELVIPGSDLGPIHLCVWARGWTQGVSATYIIECFYYLFQISLDSFFSDSFLDSLLVALYQIPFSSPSSQPPYPALSRG